MSNSKVAVPSAVRSWARENLSSIEGLPEGYTVGDRGQFHPAIIAAYNKANPRRKYVRAAYVNPGATVKVTVVKQNASGRKTPITKTVVVSEARAAAKAAGVPLGAQGRVPASVLSDFVLGKFTE
jgi:hypothetical protein